MFPYCYLLQILQFQNYSQQLAICKSVRGQNSAYRYELWTHFSISVAMHATWKIICMPLEQILSEVVISSW